MDTKLRDTHLRVGQIWVRKRKVNRTDYTLYLRLKQKNSNNMWLLEQVLVVPNIKKGDEDYLKKEEWWAKERILEFAEMLAEDANLETLKVLFG